MFSITYLKIGCQFYSSVGSIDGKAEKIYPNYIHRMYKILHKLNIEYYFFRIKIKTSFCCLKMKNISKLPLMVVVIVSFVIC